MPFPLRRAMEQQVQRSAMQEGDRPLPQAGLLFFHYRGKAEGIRSLELIYSGARVRLRWSCSRSRHRTAPLTVTAH